MTKQHPGQHILTRNAVGMLTAQTVDSVSFDTSTCIITVTVEAKHWVPWQPHTHAKIPHVVISTGSITAYVKKEKVILGGTFLHVISGNLA